MGRATQLVWCNSSDDEPLFAAVVVLEGSDGGDGSVSVTVVPVQVSEGVGALVVALLLCLGSALGVGHHHDIAVLFRRWSIHEPESD